MPEFPVNAKTSAALQRRMFALGLKEEDLKEDFVRGSGRGGQKKNKSSVCVMLKHEPTGLIVRADQERSQGLNRFFARRQMVEMLEARKLGKRAPKQKKADKIRKQKARRQRRATKAVADGEKSNE